MRFEIRDPVGIVAMQVISLAATVGVGSDVAQADTRMTDAKNRLRWIMSFPMLLLLIC